MLLIPSIKRAYGLRTLHGPPGPLTDHVIAPPQLPQLPSLAFSAILSRKKNGDAGWIGAWVDRVWLDWARSINMLTFVVPPGSSGLGVGGAVRDCKQPNKDPSATERLPPGRDCQQETRGPQGDLNNDEFKTSPA